MKTRIKIVSIILALFTVLFIGCKNELTTNSSGIPNLKGIKDFAKYKKIGAGSYSSVARSARAADGSIIIDPKEGVKLIGELEDGSLELIKFIDEDGVTKEQSWYLTYIYLDSNYAFISFSETKGTSLQTGRDLLSSVNNYKSDDRYILDLKDGNLYSTEIFDFDYIGCSSYDINGNAITYVFGTLNNTKGTYTLSTVVDNEINKLEIKFFLPEDVLFPITGDKDKYGTICDGTYIYANEALKSVNSDSIQMRLNKTNGIFYSYSIDYPCASFYHTGNKGSAFPCYESYENYYKLDENGDVVVNNDEDFPPCIKVYADERIRKEHFYPDIQTLLKTNEEEIYIQHEFNFLLTVEGGKGHNIYELQDKGYKVHVKEYNNNGVETETVYNKISDLFTSYPDDAIYIFTDNENVIVYKKDGAFYKYNISSNTSEKIIETASEIKGYNVTDNNIYFYTYDSSYNKTEYYIYPDGTISNTYKEFSNNKVYLVPIA